MLSVFSATLGLLTQQTFSGHLQTGYAVVGDFSQADPVVYDRFVNCACQTIVGWIT
jgi:hypothetical protein